MVRVEEEVFLDPKVLTRRVGRKNETTGAFAGYITYDVVVDAHELSIDEFPPAGVEGELSKTPPPTLDGVTSYQVETKMNKAKVPGTISGQPTGDRD